MTEKQEPASEAAVQAAADVWVVVGRLRRKLRAQLGGTDGEIELSPAQASVLARLDKTGPASASDLATIEGVRPQSMAKVVIALEEVGFVVRTPDPGDRRRQLVTLTESGLARRKGDREARRAWLARALDEHGTEEQIQAVITAMALLDEVAQA
ncbi:MarR family winged helix-turn-helix transcriptional regulator [Streptomyces sp. VRA16 Mangrove soil]|uniref:MarR family winged helix-turn-helix transcriptional regulator n=1 Tax=Streptomyces sp. VRA16 Mangrove soil TaxID=2817434 RepID=UPI001A9E148E|nr:MarR family transcriptional regulator [Streptomyces sp. VRA16 Mangrove soil]MBO1332214.1 MarR family transcriptional regulator [Streptomyces sp. VRA16 Mangrove soil]